MSLQPGVFENEEGERTLPFGDDQDAPFFATTANPERDALGGISDGLKIVFENGTLGSAWVRPGTNEPKMVVNRIIMATDGEHELKWTLNDDVHVTRATWVLRDDTILMNSSAALLPRIDMNRPQMTISTTDNKLELPVSEVMGSTLSQYSAQDMFIKVYWTMDDSGENFTRSGVFTVYNGTLNDPTYGELWNELDHKRATSSSDDVGANEGDAALDPESNPTRAIGSLPTGTVTSSPTLSANPSSITSNDDSGGGSGGGGLAAGAIAGIVIGVVLGVAIIALLIWFLLRRRRRRADHVQNGGYGSGPHEYLADKEIHARAVESPHSPYSDDGRQQQQQPQSSQRHLNDTVQDPVVALPASANSPTEHRPPFAPYNEQEHAPIASRSLNNLNVNLESASSSTPNVNSNVSHLIEDGMTEDEIRRLEEEERALDAAIEQAGQEGQRR